jgi:hypothetical protein
MKTAAIDGDPADIFDASSARSGRVAVPYSAAAFSADAS